MQPQIFRQLWSTRNYLYITLNMIFLLDCCKFTQSDEIFRSIFDLIYGVILIDEIVIDPFPSFYYLDLHFSIQFQQNQCVFSFN